jgi:hypothetical protein
MYEPTLEELRKARKRFVQSLISGKDPEAEGSLRSMFAAKSEWKTREERLLRSAIESALTRTQE